MFKVGDRVGYSNEDYDQDEIGIVEEVLTNRAEFEASYAGLDVEYDENDVCYAVHWQTANFSSTIHQSMLKFK